MDSLSQTEVDILRLAGGFSIGAMTEMLGLPLENMKRFLGKMSEKHLVLFSPFY
jgi:hypothetical protein